MRAIDGAAVDAAAVLFEVHHCLQFGKRLLQLR
jgi:hypothetical protein